MLAKRAIVGRKGRDGSRGSLRSFVRQKPKRLTQDDNSFYFRPSTTHKSESSRE
jgi:hypothetical protein